MIEFEDIIESKENKISTFSARMNLPQCKKMVLSISIERFFSTTATLLLRNKIEINSHLSAIFNSIGEFTLAF